MAAGINHYQNGWWHAFRRGLASDMSRDAIDLGDISSVMRHSSAKVTQEHYLKKKE